MGNRKGADGMNWMDMTQREFQAALASSSPTPGGGTASAIALGQAASLACMVADLTLGSEKWSAGWPAAEHVQEIAIPMMTRSGILAEEDSDAFDEVMAAFKMPKSSDSEKTHRRTAIRSGTLQAAKVPFETAEVALALLKALTELAVHGNANAVTDVGVAGLLASAAAKGALFNVEINLQSLPDDMGVALREMMPGMLQQAKLDSRSVMEAVRTRMSN
ncbi:MAG: cyclodeaminase/cyclohydrolase family protein [Euryarchaeota archaeon]|jgi:formiminotetrahydrofolate cyclodeaminase|nr:cyclodeaminase/cyclohydrolase family protein [Euryarchaeota archaeon]MBT5660876.1 cyclodeaminase/cyclohydrolase family protein [Euryarchaeota archaeon]